MINKTFVAIVLAVGLLLSIGCAMSQQRVLPAENYTLLDLNKFAVENPIDSKVGFLTKEAASGKNASINLAQAAPGAHFGAQYHGASDEIDYVIQGQANMTIGGKVLPIKSGDLIYIPRFTVHDFYVLGNENLKIIVFFTPPLTEKDRNYV